MSITSRVPTMSSTRISTWASTLSITLLLVVFVPLHAVAANVTFAWDPNSEPDLAGYVLYHKDQASTQYLDSVVVGDTTGYTMSGLEPGHTYDFVLTAFDASGNESDFSAPVSFMATDTVTILRAYYSIRRRLLTVKASSSAAPDAQLQVEGYGEMAYLPTIGEYLLWKRLQSKPASVAVTSSLGGSATVSVP